MRSYFEEALAAWFLADNRERHRWAIERAIAAVKHAPSSRDLWWRQQWYRAEARRRRWAARDVAMPPWGWRARHGVMGNGNP